MAIELTKCVGLLGLALVSIEIWYPQLIKKFESYINNEIKEQKEFKENFIKRMKKLSKVAESSFQKVAEGPQLVTVDEFKGNAVTSFENIKSYLHFYGIMIMYVVVLLPLRLTLVSLNKFA